MLLVRYLGAVDAVVLWGSAVGGGCPSRRQLALHAVCDFASPFGLRSAPPQDERMRVAGAAGRVQGCDRSASPTVTKVR